MSEFNSEDYKNKSKKYNDKEATQEEPQKKQIIPTTEEIKNGLMIFFGGTALGLAVYLLAIWSLSSFNVGYILGAVIALTIAIIVIWAIDKSMGFKESRMKAAIFMVLCIAFIFTILNGYKERPNSLKDKVVVNSSSQVRILNFTGTESDTKWKSSGITRLAGESYRVTVRGASVNLIDGSGFVELTENHGAYIFQVNSSGTPTLQGINHGGATSTVVIEAR